MIKVHSLHRNYGDFKAIDNVSFEINQGEIVGLLGHNGAGKTTIMKMMTGYLEPSAGTIQVDQLQMDSDMRAIQARIGYLPENCPVWPEMTVMDYLEYQAHLHGVDEAQTAAAVVRAISRTALKEKATATIQTLSRGYRQRVGVAQAILHSPDIIILDEPTNGLDPTQIFQMRELIRELAKSATVIVSTHILQEVQAVCERVLILHGGRLVVDSRLDELQSGGQLRVRIKGADAADYLGRVDGVAQVQVLASAEGISSYLLDCEHTVAPAVAAAIAAAGHQLYGLSPEVRTLETVFAEVNAGQTEVA